MSSELLEDVLNLQKRVRILEQNLPVRSETDRIKDLEREVKRLNRVISLIISDEAVKHLESEANNEL